MKILWYASQLIESGGGERFIFEISQELKNNGHEVQITCDILDEEKIYDGKYDTKDVVSLNLNYKNETSYIKKSVMKFLGLNKIFREISSFKPDLIICQSEFDSIRLNLVTFFMKIPMRIFIFGQMFQFKSDISKYSLIFKKNLSSIIQKQPDYINRLGPKPHFFREPIIFITNEVISLLKYWSVRKAEKVFVLSNQVKTEVEILYKKSSEVLRGAIRRDNIKESDFEKCLPISENPIIVSCCRLDEKKRVDLIIKSFVSSNIKGELIIIGDGPEIGKLKEIARESVKKDSIKFLGRVSDNEKDLNIKYCDVFISMDNSDFVISGIEAIAKGKRVILSNHFDIGSFSNPIKGIKMIDPSLESLSSLLDDLKSIDSPEKSNIHALDEITWENAAKRLLD
tara:strand:+ start:10488 stop:11681 length:1194 start_codon:yes stop_codon:yes gene_type:complete